MTRFDSFVACEVFCLAEGIGSPVNRSCPTGQTDHFGAIGYIKREDQRGFISPLHLPSKLTLPLRLLLLFTLTLMLKRQFRRQTEILFLALPAPIYLVVAMSSQMNIGVRHILPMYPFLCVLVAGGTSKFRYQEPLVAIRGSLPLSLARG